MPTKKQAQRLRKKARVRAKVSGTTKRPRLSVYRSLTCTHAQLIDDDKGVTLASVSSKDKTINSALEAGKELAKKAQDKKITSCVFDRNGFAYHGRVKALADGTREGGLKF